MSVDRSANAAQHLRKARSQLTTLQEPDESLEASLQRDRNEYYANLLKAHEQARRTVAGDHVPSSRRK